MSASVYRRLRFVVGGLTLGLLGLAFADIGDWIGPAVARAMVWPQFAPSLLGLLSGAGWIAAGCLAVVLLTLLFGRVYCAMLCPLGVLMDLAAKLAGRTGRRRQLPFRRGRNRLRGLVVAVCAGGLLAGMALPLAFLDPYSIFGKITAATVRPLVGAGNHAVAATGWVHPLKVSPVAWTTAGVALGLLILVVAAAVMRGRIFCNTLCPVGAVLGFFSKRALFRLHIAESACAACSMCERVCPAQCIDFRNHRIDHSRCVMCLDCVTSCKRNGIHLRLARRVPEAHQTDPQPVAHGNAMTVIDRRLFLAGAVAIPGAALAGQIRDSVAGEDFKARAVLPPGARSLDRFRSRCTACHLCVANCPDQVLRPSITAHGLAGFLQPYQDFTVSFCSYNCSNCSQVCPTGAIEPITIEERRTVRTGIVRLFLDLCVVKTQGTSCGACNEHCPTQAVRMVPWQKGLTIPEIEPDLCVGCGGCEFICPVRPQRAIVVDGLPVHDRAKQVELGTENLVREIEEEFPF